MSDLEELERQSRNGWIELHDWKRIPFSMTTREATSSEVEYINKMLNR